MIAVLCAALALGALILGKLWRDAKAQIEALQKQVASLKRQLRSGRS